MSKLLFSSVLSTFWETFWVCIPCSSELCLGLQTQWLTPGCIFSSPLAGKKGSPFLLHLSSYNRPVLLFYLLESSLLTLLFDVESISDVVGENWSKPICCPVDSPFEHLPQGFWAGRGKYKWCFQEFCCLALVCRIIGMVLEGSSSPQWGESRFMWFLSLEFCHYCRSFILLF